VQHDFQAIVDGGRTVAADSAAAMYAAARLYYDEGLTQHEVAKRLSVSRSTVSRLLQLARDNDIVRIEVRAPSPAAGLSADLAAELGLQRAIVVPAQGPRAGLQALVAPALDELARTELAAGDVLAVSWGKTVWEIAQAQRFPSLRGVRLVPAVGGMDEDDVRFQPNEIARRVAAASGGEVSFLHAPALPSPELRRSLLSDPQIAERLALWNRIDTALGGIGMPPAALGVGPAHVLAAREALAAAVGDVASRHFDMAGEPVELPHEDMLLAVTRAQLRNAGTVIGVAAGPEKAASIIGAARARLVDVLVTDAVTASAALEMLRAAA